MKRLAIILLLLIVSSVSLFAIEEKLIDNNSKDLVVRGFVKKYCLVNVHPINSQGSGSSGFPFDLLGNDVAYSDLNSDPLHGRVIATWIVASNYANRTLQITPTDLVNGSASIGYYLKLKMTFLGENSDGTLTPKPRTVVVHSGESSTINLSNISDRTGEESPFFMSTEEDQTIKIMLDDYPDSIKQNDALWPNGTYTASVNFYIGGL